ncbi:MAG: hypothetical protein Unbinned706contig1000_9 [Prokaryotic dsDNA virus sp.]|nr:MAG: hypothetical protein Unbinned706contig1000_9 [Prokaryotic dsDNA virus sp.]|tara:strand:+ start:12452 stop:13243 length:792 start_codon:yes stop_codon:yes gene_type:complete
MIDESILLEVISRAKAGDKSAIAFVSEKVRLKAIANLKSIEKQGELDVINNIKANIENLSKSVIQVASIVDSNNAVIGDAINKSKRNSKKAIKEQSEALHKQLSAISSQVLAIESKPTPERVIETRTVVEKETIRERGDIIVEQPISINEVFEPKEVVEYVEQGAIDKLFKEFEYRLRRDIQNQMDLRQYSGSGGGAGKIEIRQDGDIISSSAKCLNFTGVDVLAQKDPNNPDCINIYIPPEQPNNQPWVDGELWVDSEEWIG